MTDAYPPSRLDMGGKEPAPDTTGTTAVRPKPAAGWHDEIEQSGPHPI
jgi:hypothetical protein